MRSPLPLAPAPFLAAEALFDKVVAKVGGCRVDSLVKPRAENADYVFSDANVIAELKVIEKDLRTDPETTARVSEIFGSHANEAGMPSMCGRLPVRVDLLPKPARDEILDHFKKKFERPIKKAASQIKSTRTLLGMPDATGLLILVNDSSTFADPAIVACLLGRVLQHHHTSIDHVVFCMMNMFWYSPSTPEGSRLWFPAQVVNRSRKLALPFANALREAWQDTIDAEIGVESPRLFLPVPETIAAPMRVASPPIRGPADVFLRPGRYYRSKLTGASVYCRAVELGSAQLVHLEILGVPWTKLEISSCKLIYATHLQFDEITDIAEVQRLKSIVVALRRTATSERSTS